ncbi:ATP-binding protein [Actomonas aquatica]|uniref:histidine kinase n=1 Tax=Actomonas aquatica TaxID=2866162 RepID=A0ABZ1C7Q7_9BACT|nr:ATP-binding protein [Opitutus sp. WL0086]WRQ87670.1 ATP-binding protein [Opitutus sp. WL0086]
MPAPFGNLCGLPWRQRRVWLLVALVVGLTGGSGVRLSAQDASAPSTWADRVAAARQGEARDAKQALQWAEEAVALASSRAEHLEAQLVKASIQRRLGDYDEAMLAARAGVREAHALGNLAMEAEFLYLVGRLQWSLADYPGSIETHLRQLEVAEASREVLLVSKAHTGLGLTLESFGDTARAGEHLLDALRLAELAEDTRQLAIVHNSLGNHYLGAGQLDRATSHHEQALALRRQLGSVRGIADSLNNLALIAHARGESERALALLDESREIYERLDLKRYVANVHRRIGGILREVGRYDLAKTHLTEGLAAGSNLGSSEVLARIYEELALTHEALGEWADALRYERLRAEATEAAHSVEARQRVAELSARYEAERREHEIDLLRRDQALQAAELRRRRLVTGFVVTALGGLALGLVGAVWFQRVRLRQERRVRAATEDARDRAEEAEGLKSRLLRLASHDLKAPLATLRATAHRIEHDSPEGSLAHRLAASMRIDATRMDLLVHDLLDAAAIEDQVFTLNPTCFDLGQLCRESIDSLQSVALEKSQPLQLKVAKDLPPILADRERIWQILSNLLSNALKFTPPEGQVELRVESSPGWFTLEVEDDGPGLTPQDMARVFGPYARLSAQPTGGEHSSGLGLSITRQLVSLHRGRLEVESQPGSGAIFRVLLPAKVSTEPAVQTPAHERGDVV